MSIIETPLETWLSAYRPVKFVLESTGISNVENAAVTVLFQREEDVGQEYEWEFKIAWRQFTGPDTYTFEFDLSSMAQVVLFPKSGERTTIFGEPLWQEFEIKNYYMASIFVIQVQYEYRDPSTGLLVLDATQYQSSSYRVSPVILRHIQAGKKLTLTPYVWPLNLVEIEFLDNHRAIGKTISIHEHFSLSFFGEGINQVQVTRQQFDTTTTTDAFNLTAFTDAFNGIYSVGAGPANVNDISTWVGGGVTIDANTERYWFVIGWWDGAIFTARSDAMTFTLDHNPCADGIRLHWLNFACGADAHTFNNIKIFSNKINSEIAETPLPWKTTSDDYTNNTHHDPERAGRQRFDVDILGYFEIESKSVIPAESERFAELIHSPEVYMEPPLADQEDFDAFIPVVIRDVTDEVTIARELTTKKFIVEHAYKDPRQRK